MNWYKLAQFRVSKIKDWWIDEIGMPHQVGAEPYMGGPSLVNKAILEKNNLNSVSGYENEETLASYGLSDIEIDILKGRKDPTDYLLEHLGWTRINNDTIYVWSLSNEKLKEILNALWAFYNEEEKNMNFNIEIRSTGESVSNIPYEVLSQGNLDALRQTQMPI